MRFERFCEEIDKLRNADKLRVATLEQIVNGNWEDEEVWDGNDKEPSHRVEH